MIADLAPKPRNSVITSNPCREETPAIKHQALCTHDESSRYIYDKVQHLVE